MSTKRNLNKVIWPWIAVVLWMIVIFRLSAQPESQSNGLSKSVTGIIVESIGKIVPIDVEISTVADWKIHLNHIVRKFGHFFEYFILEILVMNAFRKCRNEDSRVMIFSFLFCVIYASSDEIHQLFVPGRGGQVKDVFIDSFGALMGIVFFKVAILLKSTKTHRNVKTSKK